MPGYDGTGPRGMGPMTGGGRGYCAVPAGRGGGYAPAGRFLRRGKRGRRNWYYATGMPGWQRAADGMPAYGAGPGPYAGTAAGEEKEVLKREAEVLKRELEEIQNRIQALEEIREQEKTDGR